MQSPYRPTNVISITDGQIFLEGELFYSGIRPAINVGISVSRVGGNAQTRAMRQVAGSLRLDLAQYRELAAFAQFGSELDKTTQAQLTRGERLVEILKQGLYAPWSQENQVTILFAGSKGYMDSVSTSEIDRYQKEFITFMENSKPDILKEIKTEKKLSEDLENKLHEACKEFNGVFQPEQTT